MATHDNLRVGDAERDAVAGALREHFAQGRLTLDELRERLDATFAARTRGDLVPLTADLPPTRPAAPVTGPDPGPGRSGPRWRGRPPWAAWWLVPPWFLLLGVFAVIAAGHGHPWLLVLLVVLAVVRFRVHRHWRHYGPWPAGWHGSGYRGGYGGTYGSTYGRGALRR